MAHDLNPSQKEAVNTLRGPMLVLAGAGSGKTRVVTFRIARLIQSGVRPSRILAVTFTNKAAAEMQERVAQQIGKRGKEKPEVSTFHSHCVRVLRRNIQHLGYPAAFTIYDQGDQESVARTALREIKVSDALLRPRDLLFQIGAWKCQCIRPDEAARVAGSDKEHLAALAYRKYQKMLKARGAVDFDDLLLCTEELFEKFAEVRRQEASRYDHLLIDEYQDTNGSQYRIVKALAQAHRNLCVVGDDDQAIYGWRGADVQHILKFHRDWPDAKIVRLEENYRCTAEILDLANKVIGYNASRHGKVLKAVRGAGEKPRILAFEDEETEAIETVMDIHRRLKSNEQEPNDFAILFRTNQQPRPFESELRRLKIPYVVVGGNSFFDRKEVRDILSYLRVIAMPQDEQALLRILNTPARGIGDKAIEKIMAQAVEKSIPFWEAASANDGLTAQATASVGKFRQLVQEFQERFEKGSLTEQTRALIAAIGYHEYLRGEYKEEKEVQARWEAVEEVVNAVAAYEKGERYPNLRNFLDSVTLDAPDTSDEKEKQLQRNAVVLITLHAAKGLEFPHVYLVGMEEGLMPHHRSIADEGTAIDEERRLCYVGITRAQDRLTFSYAQSRMKWGKPRESIPSRFLFEVTGQADRAPTANGKRFVQAARGGANSPKKKAAPRKKS